MIPPLLLLLLLPGPGCCPRGNTVAAVEEEGKGVEVGEGEAAPPAAVSASGPPARRKADRVAGWDSYWEFMG
jgi:hypothetical protein